ncbi:MAG: glycosyltransferase family 4 protein [Acidobacteriota bacterium]
MKKIAYLVSQYPAISHTFILREVRGLRDRRVEIEVASINAPDRDDEGLTAEEREEAARTFYVKRQGVPGAAKAHLGAVLSRPNAYFRGLRRALRLAGAGFSRKLLFVFYWTEALLLAAWMRKNGCTHLHVHFATAASTVGLLLAEMEDVGFSLTVHGPDEFYDAPGFLLREKIEAADFVCCISSFARSQLMKLSDFEHWHKFDVAYLGVDPEHFAPRREPVERTSFGVVCVGRLVPAKGQHILVQALAELAGKGVDVRLDLIGDGPDRESLEGLCEQLACRDRVTFHGSVNQDRLRDHLARADVFCIPSFAEGIPVVLMEAMSMEIPCVTTRITGIPELITDGENGLLVPASDVGRLAAALKSLADDAERRALLSRAGRVKVVEDFNSERNLDVLARVFERRLAALPETTVEPATLGEAA